MSDCSFKSIVIGDSRLCGFDRKNTGEIDIDFVIIRGAHVNDVLVPALDKIRSLQTFEGGILIIKIALGINHFTEFVRHGQGVELKYSGATGCQVFNELRSFKQRIKSVRPDALVGFVTVPTISFVANKNYRLEAGKLKSSIYSDEQLQCFQITLDQEITLLNFKLKEENSFKQDGHNRGCMTVSWHKYVTRSSKRKRNKQSTKSQTVVRNNFSGLYDGIHAISTLKQKWFYDLCACIRKEQSYTLYEKSKTVHVSLEDTSDSEA